MKRINISFNYIILLVFCLVVFSFLGGMPVFADVNNFYFRDFTGDYYLSRDSDGLSHLKVVESVTAVFPDYNQNKGICRQIPFTNQNGTNLTLPRLTKSDIVLTRNGEPEPIYSIEKEANYYNVCTGTDEYVLGEQTYVFEYQFENVVTEFNVDGREFQELYWDTNGNGAMQKFEVVTARLHFEEPNVYADKSWCYVGSYGKSDQDRCVVLEIEDGVEFKAANLASFENLTFDVELKPDSFVLPEPVKNYTYVWLALVALGVSLLVISRFLVKYLKSREKSEYYKGIFVAPQYQPSKDYSLPEMAEIFIGKKKDMKVAMLLEMVVKKQIELKKVDKKNWSVILKKEVPAEYLDLLKILNGGDKPNIDDEIEIKKQKASNRLITIKSAMESKILGDLKKDGLVEDKYNFGTSSGRGVGNVIAMSLVMVPIVVMFGLFLMSMLQEILGLDMTYGQEMVFYPYFYKSMLVLIMVTVVICVVLSDAVQKYARHTKKGLEASRYMDGLELYIRMAEAERIKFLQGIDKVDVSAKGIVKLYEKLLPYAAIFGLEESWMKEMKDYCKVEEIDEPDYLLNGIVASEMMRSIHNATSYVNTATTMSSSGGGASSGFSGGGGGGFSGGGGGGGGFSGR